MVVLTSSESPVDIATVYGLRASCYGIKPLSLNEFEARIRGIATFLAQDGSATRPVTGRPT